MLNLGLDTKFVRETLDENGMLVDYTLDYPETFNFAYDIVDAAAGLDPGRLALLWCDVEGNERRFTYREIMEKSNQTANYFLSLGVRKGDRVMLVLKRHYQYWFSILALHKIGAVAIPATHLLTTKDYVYRFQSASVKAVVATTDQNTPAAIDEAAKQCPELQIKVSVKGAVPGWHDFDGELPSFPTELPRQDTKAHEPMLLYFTSGTTGYPKMVYHDYTYALAHIITAKYWQQVEPGTIHLTISDTGWGKAAWGKLYGQWTMGATVLVYDFDKFDPAQMLGVMSKYKITSFCAPPTMFRFFIKEGIEHYDLSSLKHASIAGEALNPEVFYRFQEYTGLRLMEGFGQTETTLILGNLKGMEPKPGSMGKPSPMYHVDVVDEEGNSVPPGETGEIVLRVKEGEKQPGLFCGYYRDEARTTEVWHDGLYHTRDTAWRDEDGYYWYVGRTDDVIKSSGYRIGPFEIESVLMEHPSVLECAVTGAPDPVRGQVIKATIVLAKGYEESEELKKELQTYVKKQTAPYKYPRIVQFVKELPKTISGKIKRNEIQ